MASGLQRDIRRSYDNVAPVLRQSLPRRLCDLRFVCEGQVVRNDVVGIGGIDNARDQESVAKIFEDPHYVAGQGFGIQARKSIDDCQLQIEGSILARTPELTTQQHLPVVASRLR